MPRNFFRDLGAARHHPRGAVARMGHVAHNRSVQPRWTCPVVSRVPIFISPRFMTRIAARPPSTFAAEVCAGQLSIIRIGTTRGSTGGDGFVV